MIWHNASVCAATQYHMASALTLLTRPFHSNFRLNKAEFFVELRDPIASCPQDPSHLLVFTHCRFNQGAPDALAAIRLRYNKHGDIAIGYAVTKRAQKTNNLAIFNRDQSDLRPR